MQDKQLKSIDKSKLLDIMRQQELEIEKLTSDSNEQIIKLTAELNKITDAKNEQNERIEKLSVENSSKNDLLDSLTEKVNYLESENERLTKRIEERKFSFENAGSLAEASLSVSGIMKAAQEAADVYLQNIRMLEEEKVTASQKIEDEAKAKADAIIKAAEEKCAEIEREERKSVEDLKSVSKQYIELISKAHVALHDTIKQYKITKLPQINEPDQHENIENIVENIENIENVEEISPSQTDDNIN